MALPHSRESENGTRPPAFTPLPEPGFSSTGGRHAWLTDAWRKVDVSVPRVDREQALPREPDIDIHLADASKRQLDRSEREEWPVDSVTVGWQRERPADRMIELNGRDRTNDVAAFRIDFPMAPSE